MKSDTHRISKLNNIDNYNFHNDLPDNQTFLLSYGNGCNLEILKKKEKIFRKIFSNLNYISPIKETFSSKIRNTLGSGTSGKIELAEINENSVKQKFTYSRFGNIFQRLQSKNKD
jgi:hypothetical protein